MQFVDDILKFGKNFLFEEIFLMKIAMDIGIIVVTSYIVFIIGFVFGKCIWAFIRNEANLASVKIKIVIIVF